MDFDLTAIITHLIASLIGLFAGYTLHIKISSKSRTDSNDNRTSQANNTVGGDMAGRDINKHN